MWMPVRKKWVAYSSFKSQIVEISDAVYMWQNRVAKGWDRISFIIFGVFYLANPRPVSFNHGWIDACSQISAGKRPKIATQRTDPAIDVNILSWRSPYQHSMLFFCRHQLNLGSSQSHFFSVSRDLNRPFWCLVDSRRPRIWKTRSQLH